jgi:phosphoglycerol transferase
VILLQYLFDFSSVDLNVPFSYNGDALLNLVSIKTLLESGWFFYNSQLGMPYGMNFLEFPGSDGFFLIVLKAIGLITHSPAYILNLFYILGFPLIYFSTYWACRQFSINIYLSISIAIVFTIAPFHFFRNLQHIFLATYFIVPLITIVIVDIGFGMPRDSNNFEPTKSVSLKYYLILVLAGMC